MCVYLTPKLNNIPMAFKIFVCSSYTYLNSNINIPNVLIFT